MDTNFSIDIQKLIELGAEKAKELESNKIKQWNEIVQLIKNDWVEIERLVKAELPTEVRDYFKISTGSIPNEYHEPTSVTDRRLTTSDIEAVVKMRPEISIFNRTGYLSIPSLSKITVEIAGETEDIKIRYYTSKQFRYPVEKYELDGSLEMALYYAKMYYEDSPRMPSLDTD